MPFIVMLLISIYFSFVGIKVDIDFITHNKDIYIYGRYFFGIANSILLLLVLLKFKLKPLMPIYLCLNLIYSIHGQWFVPCYYLAYLETLLIVSLFLPINKKVYYIITIPSLFLLVYTILNSPASYATDPILIQKFKYDCLAAIFIFSICSFFGHHYITLKRKEKDTMFDKFIDVGKNSSFIIHDFKGLTSTPYFYAEILHNKIKNNCSNDCLSQTQLLDITNKLKEEINDIQQYAKEITQLTLPEKNNDVELFKLEEIISSIQVLFRKQLDGILLKYDKEDTIIYNKNKLKKILYNIIHNSIESLKENRVDNPTIELIVKDNNLTIKDNGKGFPKKILKELNKSSIKFLSSKENGSGLGLSVIKEIIYNDNSNIEFKNDNGAVIELTLRKDKVI